MDSNITPFNYFLQMKDEPWLHYPRHSSRAQHHLRLCTRNIALHYGITTSPLTRGSGLGWPQAQVVSWFRCSLLPSSPHALKSLGSEGVLSRSFRLLICSVLRKMGEITKRLDTWGWIRGTTYVFYGETSLAHHLVDAHSAKDGQPAQVDPHLGNQLLSILNA